MNNMQKNFKQKGLRAAFNAVSAPATASPRGSGLRAAVNEGPSPEHRTGGLHAGGKYAMGLAGSRANNAFILDQQDSVTRMNEQLHMMLTMRSLGLSSAPGVGGGVMSAMPQPSSGGLRAAHGTGGESGTPGSTAQQTFDQNTHPQYQNFSGGGVGIGGIDPNGPGIRDLLNAQAASKVWDGQDVAPGSPAAAQRDARIAGYGGMPEMAATPSGGFEQPLPRTNLADSAQTSAGAYRRGGTIPGHDLSGRDDVPVKVTRGEAILPVKTVDALGGPPAVEGLIRRTNGGPPADGLRAAMGFASGYPGGQEIVPDSALNPDELAMNQREMARQAAAAQPAGGLRAAKGYASGTGYDLGKPLEFTTPHSNGIEYTPPEPNGMTLEETAARSPNPTLPRDFSEQTPRVPGYDPMATQQQAAADRLAEARRRLGGIGAQPEPPLAAANAEAVPSQLTSEPAPAPQEGAVNEGKASYYNRGKQYAGKAVDWAKNVGAAPPADIPPTTGLRSHINAPFTAPNRSLLLANTGLNSLTAGDDIGMALASNQPWYNKVGGTAEALGNVATGYLADKLKGVMPTLGASVANVGMGLRPVSTLAGLLSPTGESTLDMIRRESAAGEAPGLNTITATSAASLAKPLTGAQGNGLRAAKGYPQDAPAAPAGTRMTNDQFTAMMKGGSPETLGQGGAGQAQPSPSDSMVTAPQMGIMRRIPRTTLDTLNGQMNTSALALGVPQDALDSAPVSMAEASARGLRGAQGFQPLAQWSGDADGKMFMQMGANGMPTSIVGIGSGLSAAQRDPEREASRLANVAENARVNASLARMREDDVAKKAQARALYLDPVGTNHDLTGLRAAVLGHQMQSNDIRHKVDAESQDRQMGLMAGLRQKELEAEMHRREFGHKLAENQFGREKWAADFGKQAYDTRKKQNIDDTTTWAAGPDGKPDYEKLNGFNAYMANGAGPNGYDMGNVDPEKMHEGRMLYDMSHEASRFNSLKDLVGAGDWHATSPQDAEITDTRQGMLGMDVKVGPNWVPLKRLVGAGLLGGGGDSAKLALINKQLAKRGKQPIAP